MYVCSDGILPLFLSRAHSNWQTYRPITLVVILSTLKRIDVNKLEWEFQWLWSFYCLQLNSPSLKPLDRTLGSQIHTLVKMVTFLTLFRVSVCMHSEETHTCTRVEAIYSITTKRILGVRQSPLQTWTLGKLCKPSRKVLLCFVCTICLTD